MPVLKRQNADQFARDAVVLNLADIAQQGEAILSAARQEAERIVAAAKAERERLIGDATQVGHAAGHTAGIAEGREAGKAAGETAARAEHAEALRALQAAWSAALEEFLVQREHLLVTCKTDVLKLALSIAERITYRTIEHDEGVVCDQIEAALGLVGKPSRVTIAVHPEELALAHEVLPDLAARLDAVEHASLDGDESLTPGSCVIRTAEGGLIDASVLTQLERIAELLVPGSSASIAKPGADASKHDGTDADAPEDDEPEQRGDLAA